MRCENWKGKDNAGIIYSDMIVKVYMAIPYIHGLENPCYILSRKYTDDAIHNWLSCNGGDPHTNQKVAGEKSREIGLRGVIKVVSALASQVWRNCGNMFAYRWLVCKCSFHFSIFLVVWNYAGLSSTKDNECVQNLTHILFLHKTSFKVSEKN